MARLDETTTSAIAKSLKVSSRRVQTHLDALKTLFCLYEIHPDSLCSGKPRYVLCDVGIATYLGASFKRQLETFFFQEILAQNAFSVTPFFDHISYYRTTKGSIVDIILQKRDNTRIALKILPEESVNGLDVRILSHLSQKAPSSIRSYLAAGVTSKRTIENITVLSWAEVLTSLAKL